MLEKKWQCKTVEYLIDTNWNSIWIADRKKIKMTPRLSLDFALRKVQHVNFIVAPLC